MGNPRDSIRHPGHAAKRQPPGIRAFGKLEKPRFAQPWGACCIRRRPRLSQTGGAGPCTPSYQGTVALRVAAAGAPRRPERRAADRAREPSRCLTGRASRAFRLLRPGRPCDPPGRPGPSGTGAGTRRGHPASVVALRRLAWRVPHRVHAAAVRVHPDCAIIDQFRLKRRVSGGATRLLCHRQGWVRQAPAPPVAVAVR